MLIGDVRTADLDRDHWHTWADMATQSVRVGLCPLAGTDDFQFTAPIAPDANPELTLATYQKTLEEASGRTDIRLTDLTWSSVYRVNIRMAERFRTGIPRRAGRASTPASRTPTTSAGNSRRSSTARPRPSWTPTRRSGCPSPPQSSASARPCTRRPSRGRRTRTSAARRRSSSSSATPTARSRTARSALRGPQLTVLAFDSFDTAFAYPGVRVVTIGEAGEYQDRDGEVRAAYTSDGAALTLIRPDGYIACTGDADTIRTRLSGLSSTTA